MPHTPQELIEEFDEKFTDNGNGWSSTNIYRDGGRKTIEDLKSFLLSAFTRLQAERDREWMERVEQAKIRMLKLARKTDYADMTEYDECARILQKVLNQAAEEIRKAKE